MSIRQIDNVVVTPCERFPWGGGRHLVWLHLGFRCCNSAAFPQCRSEESRQPWFPPSYVRGAFKSLKLRLLLSGRLRLMKVNLF